MTEVERQILEAIYRLEEASLRQNQFNIWLTPSQITTALAPEVQLSEAQVRLGLRELWIMRKVLQVCFDSSSPEELRDVQLDERDGDGQNRTLLLEQDDVRGAPHACHHQVAIYPLKADTRYRSRTAEIARMLSMNYQRFNMAPATGVLRYERRPQRRPRYTRPIPQFSQELTDDVNSGRFRIVFDNDVTQDFALDPSVDRPHLVNAITSVLSAVGAVLAAPDRPPMLAEFQVRSILASLAGLYSTAFRDHYDGHIVTAGVGSGKSYAFQIGALIHVAYKALLGRQSPQVLLLYPRVVLAANQFRDLQEIITEASARLGVQLLEPPLDAGGQLRAQMGIDEQQGGGTLEAIRQAYQGAYQILVSNLDTLANRIFHPEASAGLTQDLDLMVFDEVHLLSGIYGGHARMLVRRLELMRRMRRAWSDHSQLHFENLTASSDSVRPPYFIGASATVAEPSRHFGRILSRHHSRILHIGPADMEETGWIHHLFLRQRPEISSITAAVNATACLIHNRRDGAFREYYERADGQPIGLTDLSNPVQPSATVRLRDPASIHKTLGFCDSLDSVGRWADLVADNEQTKTNSMPNGPSPRTVPYFVRFQEPLWRVVHHASFKAAPDVWQERLRVHYGMICRECKRGVRCRVPRLPQGLTRVQQERVTAIWSLDPSQKHSYLAHLGVDPDFYQAPWFQSLRVAAQADEIGNLDECAFWQCGLCWWWSMDHLGSNRPTPPSFQNPLSGHKQPVSTPESLYHAVNAIRLRTFTSNYEFDATSLGSINDVFRESGSRIFRGKPFANAEENALFLIGSPKIEVGIDMDRVCEGITFRAMRDPASFQQKIGRVGRERKSDSLVVHVVTGSLREQYYFRNPKIALDTAYLQPIPLHERNVIVQRNHYFMAIMDFLCLQAQAPTVDRIPDHGDRLNLVNDQDFGHFSTWASKVQAVYGYLFGNHPRQSRNLNNLRWYLSQLGADDVDLQHPGYADPGPGTGISTQIAGAIDAFQHEFGPGFLLTPLTIRGQQASLAQVCQYPKSVLVTQFPGLPRHERFIREYYDSENRVRDRSYLWQLMSLKLFYRGIPGLNLRGNQPWVWVAKLFESTGNESVQIFEQRDTRRIDKDVETVSLAIALLCPGTFTYRYYDDTGPLKVPVSSCGAAGLVPLVPLVEAVKLTVLDSEYFEAAGCAPISGDDLPDDFQSTGGGIEVYRPRQIGLIRSSSTPRPVSRGLIADGDEASFPVPPERVYNDLPTPPRSFPLRWYRVTPRQLEQIPCRFQERFVAEPGYPALPRLPLPPVAELFTDMCFSPALEITDFVWGLDRSFTTRDPVPARLVYRDSEDPTGRAVALGHRYYAPGIVFAIDFSDDSPLGGFVSQIPNQPDSPVYQSLLWQALHAFLSENARNPASPGAPPWEQGSRPSVFTVQHLTKIVVFHLLDRWHPGSTTNCGPQTAFRPTLADLATCFTVSHANFITPDRFDLLCERIARLQNPFDASSRADTLRSCRPNFDAACSVVANLDAQLLRRTAKNILLNSIGLTVHEAALRLTGAEDSDISYFYKLHDDRTATIYLFDTDEYGNGTCGLVRDAFYVSPIERTLVARLAALGQNQDPLPSTDFLGCFEDALQECESAQAAHLAFHAMPAAAEPMVALRGAVEGERQTAWRAFDFVRLSIGLPSYDDLIPFQVCPEFLAYLASPDAGYQRYAGQQLLGSAEFPTFQSLEAAMGMCLKGCIDCLVSPESNVRGPLAATMTVNKIMLDAAYRVVVCEAGTVRANLAYPATGTGRTVAWDQLALSVAAATAAEIPGAAPLHVQLVQSVAGGTGSVTVVPATMAGPWDRVFRTDWAAAPAPTSLVRPRMSL